MRGLFRSSELSQQALGAQVPVRGLRPALDEPAFLWCEIPVGREQPSVLGRVMSPAHRQIRRYRIPRPDTLGGQGDDVVSRLIGAVLALQPTNETPALRDAYASPEGEFLRLGVGDMAGTGFTCPAAVFSGSTLVRISFRPPAIALATRLANLVRIRCAVLRVLRALAGLAPGLQVVRAGAIAGPLRGRSSVTTLRAPLLRRDWDLIGGPGRILRPVLAFARPVTLPAAVIQPVLPALVFAELLG